MKEELSTEWAEMLGLYHLDYYRDGEDIYNSLIDMIRTACDGSFDIYSGFTRGIGIVIEQIKPLPWDYMYNVMKLSRKEFAIIVPKDLRWAEIRLDYTKPLRCFIYRIPERMLAWYDETNDCIRLKGYTGNWDQEEDTSPGYDGYGRFDSYYETIVGSVDADGNWVEQPAISWE